MTYTMSDKAIRSRKLQADWEKRMFILMKRNQGWTFQRMGDHFGVTRQAVKKIWDKISSMTVRELEEEYQKYIGE